MSGDEVLFAQGPGLQGSVGVKRQSVRWTGFGGDSMRPFSRPVQLYILAVIVGGGAVLVASLPPHREPVDPVLFAILALLGTVAGVYPLPLVYRHGFINLTGGILLMGMFLGTPPTACLLAAVAAIFSGFLRRRRLWNVLFMAGVNILSIAVSASFYHRMVDPAMLPLDRWENVLALYISGAAYWLANSAMVMVLVAGRNGVRFWRAYVKNWEEVYLQCILLTLLAVLGAAAWRQGPVYATLLVVPAVAAYQLLSITHLKQEQAIHAIEIIAEVLDRRKPFTFQHSHRVAEYAVRIARQLGISEIDLDILRRAALIHDLGKLGVGDPSEDFPRPSRELTDYQFYSVKQHAHLGAIIAREIPAFEDTQEMIHYHHDWFDGSHVSKDHRGEKIPLGSRIIAVADSYDRLCMANGEATLSCDPVAVEELRTMAGRQLDPALISRLIVILQSEPIEELSTVPAAHTATAR